MANSPEKTPLSPIEVNAILGLEDGEPAAAPQPMFRPARAGEPQFELESRRDTALANALFGEARNMKRILDDAALTARERETANASHATFMRALLEFLRHVGTEE